MLIAMVFVFVICWIPLNALWIFIDIKRADPNFNLPYLDAIFFTCHIIAMGSAVYNPLLYAWLNDTFRRNLRSLHPCLFLLTSSAPEDGEDGEGAGRPGDDCATEQQQRLTTFPKTRKEPKPACCNLGAANATSIPAESFDKNQKR